MLRLERGAWLTRQMMTASDKRVHIPTHISTCTLANSQPVPFPRNDAVVVIGPIHSPPLVHI